MSALFAEIRRRKVFQTFVPYLGFVWLILQIISVITPMFNLSLLFNTLVAVILFAGMPIMLYLSWYFDFTLDGLLPIPDAESEEVSPFGLSRWAVLTLITVGSGLLAYRYFSTVQIEFAKANDGIQQTFIANSIAVLPFKDASADQDQAFIAQGLAEEITSLLGRTNGLKVAASSSTSILADKGLDPVSIARRLRVDTILTGSVRVTGDQLKIRVELINANDAKVLWSETFARKFTDIFNVESEIARSTVNMLQDTYIETGSLTNSATTKSTDAYVIYLKGREQYRKQTTESMKEARKLFEQAIGLDPEYAQAYVALADTIAMLAKGTEGFDHDAFFGVLDGKIAAKLSEQYLEKALVRNADLAEAYAVRGLSLAYLLNETDDAFSSLDKAINLNPNLAKAYLWKFALLDRIGKYSEAWEILKMASELDPISVANQYNRGFYLSEKGRIEEANKQFELLIQDFPESPLGYAGLASSLYLTGDLSSSLKYWKMAVDISPNNQNYKVSYIDILSSLGFIEEAKKISQDPFFTATYLLLEKNYSELFEYMNFELAAKPDDPWLLYESAFYQLIVGDELVAKEQLLNAFALFSADEIFNLPDCRPAIEIAWALKENNQLVQAENIMDKCQKLSKRTQKEIPHNSLSYYLAARIFALKDQVDSSAEELSLSIEKGWRLWWTKYDPIIAPVLETDAGKDLMIKIDEHLKKEREEVRQLNIF